MLCAIAAQPSAAPQRGSIADRPTAIYGVKRLPGEAACAALYLAQRAGSREHLRLRPPDGRMIRKGKGGW